MIGDQWEGPALPQTWMFKVKPVHLNPLKVRPVSWTRVQGRLGKEVTWRWVVRGINSSPTWIQLTLGYGESLRCRGVGNTLSPDLLIFSLLVLLLLSRFILLIVLYHLIIKCCYLCISYGLEFPRIESYSRMVSLRGKNHFLIEFRVWESSHTNLLLEL